MRFDTKARVEYYRITLITITFKATEEEAALIRALAKQEGVAVSEYIRRRATGTSAGASKPYRVRCPHTGALIFGKQKNEPPMTTELVRELLSNFP
jgi:hypothetical protein